MNVSPFISARRKSGGQACESVDPWLISSIITPLLFQEKEANPTSFIEARSGPSDAKLEAVLLTKDDRMNIVENSR
jgi:hypothetical protein